ncbi:MAG TPA: insulinase family protein [Burkholderiales bacterium]|nr:insulinase family protein [Burkholderiales bacterium]
MPLYRHWLHLLLLLAALLAGGPSSARELERRTAWPHETADMAPDPGVVWGRLANGMRYVLLPNQTPKERVSLRLLIDAGSLMERDDQRGLAHFLEHLAFKGSENMPAGDLVQYLERLGMAFGADTNARTSFESTVYQLELPANDAQLVDRSLFVLREKVDRLLIPTADLERERGVVLSEKRLRNTPQFRAIEKNLAFLFPGTRIPERMPIGLESVIAGAPRERLLDFYRTYYTPSRSTLVAAGDIDPERFAQLVHKHFDSFQARAPEVPNPQLGEVRPRGLETRFHYEPDGRTSIVLQVAQPLPPMPDVHPRRVQEMNLYLAHAIISRRLSTLSMQPGAAFLGGSAHSDEFLDLARTGTLLLNSRPEQWRAALAVGEQELRRALTHGFTVGELDEQRRSLLSDFEERARAAATRESPELADELVDILSEGRVFTSPAQDLVEVQRILAAVTPESMLKALRELWSGSGPLVFVAGPLELENPEATIAEALRASQAVAVAAPAENAIQEFAYRSFGTAPRVLERRVSDVLQVTQLRFGNNVRANLKPTKFEANSVLVAVRFGAGRLELPRDKPGLEQLAESAFVAGGLEKHSLDELNRIIAGRSVGLGFEVEDDAFVLAGRTTPGDLELQLQLLAAYLVAPGYRGEALERFRKGLPQLYQSLERTPMGVMQKDVVRFLRGGDPRFGYPEQSVLAVRTLDELRAGMRDALSHGYLEISVVGDFELEQALEALGKTFGSLPPRAAAKPAFSEARDVRFPASRGIMAFPYDTNDPKALSAVYWPTTDFSKVSDVRRLFVLAKVLGNRVLERVRNVQGLTYTAQGDHAPSHAFPDYGFLYAIVDAPPDKARTLVSEIAALGAALYRDGVTEDELERARNPVVSELKRLLNTNSYLLSAIISGSQEQPDKLLRAATSLQEVSALTVADLNEVARKYLRPEAALPVVVVPRAPAAKKASLLLPRTGAKVTPSPSPIPARWCPACPPG